MRANLIRFVKRVGRRIIGRPILGRSILVYHRVAKADFDPWNLVVSPEDFERQLTSLRGKTVLPLREFVRLHIQKRLPRKAVAITFDDGYACNALVAAPILEAFGYPATFFIVSDAIARSEEFWWDQLVLIFRAPEFDYGTATRLLASRSVNGLWKRVDRGDAPLVAFLALWDALRGLSTEARRQYLDDLRAHMRLKKEIRPTHRPMTAAELRTLAANPLFEVGGHTATHPSLPTLGPAEQEQEIVSGARCLETIIGKPIRTFSYPFGDRSPTTVEIVKRAGFDCAVSAEHRRVAALDNQFELPRRQTLSSKVHVLEKDICLRATSN